MIEECLQIQKKMLQLHAIVLYRKWGAAVGVSKRHSEGESNIGAVSGDWNLDIQRRGSGIYRRDPEEEE